jgi:hypothetical protein
MDSFVISGNDNAGEVPGSRDPLKHVLKYGFLVACEVGERGEDFAGKSGRSVPSRDNAQDFTAHRRSYHKNRVIDLGKKGWASV